MKPTPEQEARFRLWMDAIEDALNNGVDFSGISAEYGRRADGFGLLPNYWEVWMKRWAAKQKAS
jgi:hypothetical protein